MRGNLFLFFRCSLSIFMTKHESHFGNLRNPNVRHIDVHHLGSKELDEYNEFQHGITLDLQAFEQRMSNARDRLHSSCTSKKNQPKSSVY